MPLNGLRGIIFLAIVLPVSAFAAREKACVTTGEALQKLNKDICISAHIYDEVELPDGTRFLDACSPETPDDQCPFTFISYRQDRNEVGDLRRFRDLDVQVRGVIQAMRGRTAMVISHSRQFTGGPPKFRPNPRLARGFTAEQDRPPIADPNLRRQGSGRSFMNRNDRESLPR
jgi:hypothetical protein